MLRYPDPQTLEESMKTLSLDLESLRVESFVTREAHDSSAAPAAAFTVGLHCLETNFISCARPSACNLC
jgi:hypothetical protein